MNDYTHIIYNIIIFVLLFFWARDTYLPASRRFFIRLNAFLDRVEQAAKEKKEQSHES